MGRREACNNSSTMNTRYRSELESLQDTAATGNDNDRSLSLDRCHLRHTEANMAGAVMSRAVTLEVKKHQHKHNLKHRYEVMETLGKGTYGKVKKAVERATKKTVAIKSIRKETITDDLDKVHIQREIEITSSLKHPNIIRFQEVFESRDKIVIVMEYASQGELYDYVHERRRLAETEARDVFRQITSAVHYCHKKGVVHRDLKLENILLDKDLNVKLADFGLSNHFQKGRLLRTYCGSPLYASPEIVKGLPYQGPEVDCWAMGVLLYTLVYGSMPFDGASYSTLTEQIKLGRYRRPNPPSDACALIDWLLTVRVEERATVEDVANHWWVNWGYEGCVCDCVPSPHQECPSPLLARYIDWQNRVTPEPRWPSSDLPASHPATHPFYFSFPLKGDRRVGGGRVGVGASSLRKSRKENTIPQAALGACGDVGATTLSPNAVASESPSSAGTAERKKPKGILKPQRSFDSVFRPSPPEERSSPSQPCGVPSQPCRANAQTSAEGLSSSLPTHSPFRHSSSKMPKKGILKNLYGGESGYSSSPETRGSGAAGESGGTEAGVQRGQPCSYEPHPRLSGVEDSPGMQTEAVRRRKGILKRNGKFSRSLDLPNDLLSSSLTSSPLRFPEVLQRLLQATGGDTGSLTHFSRPASDDSLLSTDSFDLLDLSAQSRRRIFSQIRSTFSSEEDPENTGSETDRIGSRRSSGQGENGEGEVLLLCSGGKQC